jgi:hypothetical protein
MGFSTLRVEPHLRSIRFRSSAPPSVSKNWSSCSVTAVMERMPVQRRSDMSARVRSSACSSSPTAFARQVRHLARDRGRLRRLRGPAVIRKLLAARGAQVLDQPLPILLEQVKLVALPRTERIQPRQLVGPQFVLRQRIDLFFDLLRDLDAISLPRRDVDA